MMKIKLSQKSKLIHAFTGTPKTMLQVAKRTGIERATICGFIAQAKKRGNVELIAHGICPISKHRAGLYRMV